ncbi:MULTISPECIES: conjugal transfer protein TrbE [Kordiimonas]|jgi:type IV secretion system protein VirB4|uniref:conjugal transfer protein TrbE n=1 Tax=Kordiimonas TaxID=288021 RepID=UPI00257E1309|nr:conjugal transfer protein TrbE [Kordiimonas sp. UBA4487]
MLDLREYRKHPDRLADYLPWGFLVAPGIILNKDGSLQRSVRYRGPDLESVSAEALVAATARMNNMLRRFGSGWALFFEAARLPAGSYPKSRFPDPVSRLVDAERQAAYETASALHESDFVFTLLWLPPEDAVQRTGKLFMEAGGEGLATGGYGAHVARFVRESDRAIDLMSSLMPMVAPLDDTATLSYLHRTISDRDQDIRVPENPAYLDALLADTPLTGGLAPMLGEQHLKILSVLGYPGSTTPGLFDALNEFGFSYRWMTRFIALDKVDAERILRRARRHWFAKRKSVSALLKEVLTNEASQLGDGDALNKTADSDAALEALGADLVAYGYFSATIVVSDEVPALAEEKLRALRRLIEGQGFTTINETVGAVEAWLSSLPGQAYAHVRGVPLSTLNLDHMMPLSTVWAGEERNSHLDGPPLISARTHKSTPFRLNLHVGDVGHTLIVGPTGAGKSVFLAMIALQFRRYKRARITLFDKGGSARAATLMMGGRHYGLALGGALSFQPLRRIDESGERAFARDWLLDILAENGVPTGPDEKDAIWSALGSLASAPRVERTLTGLVALLDRAALRAAVKPYTIGGPYGTLFDADHEALTLEGLQCFETETLMAVPGALGPALAYLFHRLEDGFDGRPSLLILDEAWLFLDTPVFADRIRAWLKTLRKKNVSVIFATQGLADIAESSIAPAIIESCLTRIFLPNERACEPQQAAHYEAFGLSPRQVGIIATATPKRDYYLQCPLGCRLFDLDMGPVALAVAGAASSADQQLIDRLLTDPTGRSFAERWFRAKGLDWAAGLLAETSHPTETPHVS